MPIDLQGKIPQVKAAITPRLTIYVAVVATIVFVSIFAGFFLKARVQQQRKQISIQQQTAADASTSSRPQQEPGPTPIASLAAQPNPPLSPVQNPVVGTVGQPIVNATNLNAQPTAPAGFSAPAATPQPSLVEQPRQARVAAAQRRAELEQQAIEAPTGVKPPSSATPAPASAAYGDLAQLASWMRPASSTPQPPSSVLEAPQSNKNRFLQQPELPESDNDSKAIRTAPKSQFELWQGTRIPATLDVKILSENPGKITATVDRDVFDSATGKYVIIPATARLLGEYNSHTSYAQNRVQVVWTVLTFPDGSYLDIGRMDGYDSEGASGLRDQTDNHWKRVIGGALLTSALSAGFQISQNRSNNNSVLGYPSTSQVAAGAVGQQMQQLGQEITSRNLTIPPTLKIRPGEQVEVFVSKRIVFAGPYEPLEARQ